MNKPMLNGHKEIPVLPPDHAARAPLAPNGAADLHQQMELLQNGTEHLDQLPAFFHDSGQTPAVFRPEYRELFDFFTEGCMVTDARGIILDANQAAASLLRCRKEFLLDKPLPLFVLGERRSHFYSLLVRLQKHDSTIHNAYAILRPLRGEPVEVLIWVARTSAEESRPGALRWLLRDISSLLTAERALRAERDFAESILDNAQAIVLVLDNDHIVRSNLYARKISGYSENDLRGKDWRMLLPQADHCIVQTMICQALIHSVNGRCTSGFLTRQGGRRCIEWSAKVIAAPEGTANTMLVVGHDITELQAAQQQALQAERLAAIGQVMTRLAHECRNLLQHSQAYLERLSWRLKELPEALDLLARLQRSQRDLLHLFEDVRGYATPLRLDRAACDVRDVLREAWEQAQTVHPNKEAVLVQTGDADPCCGADRFRLLQVFRNLLDNSFSVCEASVHIEADWREETLEGKPALEVRLRDNGPGFSAEQRQRLFEPFFTTKPHGSGLGMAISKRIVTAHGGQILAGESSVPGAEIIIRLPREAT